MFANVSLKVMNRLTVLLEEIQKNQFASPTELKALATEAMLLARTTQDHDALVTALGSLSYACQVSGSYEEAFDHVLEAMEVSGIAAETRLGTRLRLSSLLSDLGADNVALLTLSSIEKEWRDGMNKQLLMRAYVSMGTSYLRQEQPELALDKLGRALNLANELGDERTMYWCIHSTGIAQSKRKNFYGALEKFQLVLPYYYETKQLYNIVAVNMLLGGVYLEIDLVRAHYHLQIALDMAVEHSFELLIVQTSINLAEFFRRIHHTEEATAALERAASLLSVKEGETKASRLLSAALSLHFERIGDLQKALEFARAD
jgi:tetratricopeptide (TPR) repeat protein